MDTTPPTPLLTMVYSPAAVVSIAPATGQTWVALPLRSVTGTQAQIDALIARLHLAPAVPPAPPVPTLTARQLRLWLLSDGVTPEAVDAQIAAIPDAGAQARARVEWEYASEYRHDHPLVIQIGTALGLSQAQIETAFRTAAQF